MSYDRILLLFSIIKLIGITQNDYWDARFCCHKNIDYLVKEAFQIVIEVY